MAVWRVLWTRIFDRGETSRRQPAQVVFATTKMSAHSSESDVEFQIPSRSKGGKASVAAAHAPAAKHEPAMDVTRRGGIARANARNNVNFDLSTAPSTSNMAEEQASDAASSDSSGGDRFYTDPKTNYRYEWCSNARQWLLCDGEEGEGAGAGAASIASANANPYETEHYKWCSETQQWIAKAQATETEHYKWDAAKGEWVPKAREESAIEVDAEGRRTYTDPDGAVYLWDKQKNAWFPKIDDEFLARYQMNYGFIDNTSADEKAKELQLKRQAELKAEELERLTAEARSGQNDAAGMDSTLARKKIAFQPPQWFNMDPTQNTKVYVSNLPLDITLDEFAEVMGKCGMIMRDPQTQKFKLKLYSEPDGQLKGDGLCDYIKVESVDLALKILDEYDLRGHKLRVERAKFEMRGEYNPALKPKRKKKDKEKFAKLKEKLFDWRPGRMRGERGKNEKVVIIRNLFEPSVFEQNVELILEYHDDLREECTKCGTVRKVVIYDRHPEGVAQVNMSTHAEADSVIQMMQGRFFGQRQLSAEHWDGQTKYKIVESKVEAQKRLSNWDNFLESGASIAEPNVAQKIEAALETDVTSETGTSFETTSPTPDPESSSEMDATPQAEVTAKADAIVKAQTPEIDEMPRAEACEVGNIQKSKTNLGTDAMPEPQVTLDMKPVLKEESTLETDAVLETEKTPAAKPISEGETTLQTDVKPEAVITLDTKSIPEGATMPETEPMPKAEAIPSSEAVAAAKVTSEKEVCGTKESTSATKVSADTHEPSEMGTALAGKVSCEEENFAKTEVPAAAATSKVDVTELPKVPSVVAATAVASKVDVTENVAKTEVPAAAAASKVDVTENVAKTEEISATETASKMDVTENVAKMEAPAAEAASKMDVTENVAKTEEISTTETASKMDVTENVAKMEVPAAEAASKMDVTENVAKTEEISATEIASKMDVTENVAKLEVPAAEAVSAVATATAGTTSKSAAQRQLEMLLFENEL